MNRLNWLILGGAIARHWPQIDFGTVEVKRTHGNYCRHRIPILLSPPLSLQTYDFISPEFGAMIEAEVEEIEMARWVFGNKECLVGYDPRTNTLLIQEKEQINEGDPQ